ncbi:MAG: carbon-nitrogen hydrolase family protein [Candidatus Kapaibacteriales bacterium]
MKIGLAQINSQPGKIDVNIEKHLEAINLASNEHCDLIAFPELSLTGYEPELANSFSGISKEKRLEVFHEIAYNKNITIAIGLPISEAGENYIGMHIYRPNKEATVYTKGKLHEDEISHFSGKKSNPIIKVDNSLISIGICYETMFEEPFSEANKINSDIYLASVAKAKIGIDKSYIHFPEMANKYSTPILMVNAVGQCTDFLNHGNSGIWDYNGKLIMSLDSREESILVYDSIANSASKIKL